MSESITRISIVNMAEEEWSYRRGEEEDIRRFVGRTEGGITELHANACSSFYHIISNWDDGILGRPRANPLRTG